ncbi:cation:proton antiporter [Aliikangiella sp. IMCC44653]
MNDPVLLLVAVGIVSIFCQFAAYKLKLPAILPLLVAGLLLGPGFGVLDPDELFGRLLFPVVTLAVAIILFEGALTLHMKDIKEHGKMVRNLCSVGALVTWALATVSAHLVLSMSWEMASLFGAIVTVTGPTVIVPMLRSVRPERKVANILRWEGIIIDPIGALFAVLVFEFLISTQDAFQHTIYAFGKTLAIGLSFGALFGYLIGIVIRNNWLPHYLVNTAVLTIMLGAFALSNELAHESGLLTVTVMGIWLANMKNVEVEDILEFKETLSVLLISGLFILLAARLNLNAVMQVGWEAIILLLILTLIVRPCSVLISAIGTDLKWNEIAILSWIAPRGIVAAAVSALFALKLESIGFEGIELLVPMVFLVIIFTVVLQSLTSVGVAKLLGVRAPPSTGVLIFGASRFGRMLAHELTSENIYTQIADTNWDAIKIARMENINTYYGNPISEHAQRELDTSLFGHVLVMSPYRQFNPLVTYHFENLLGKGSVLGLNVSDHKSRASHQVSKQYAKKLGLFDNDITYGRLQGMVERGAQVKTTGLSDNFTFKDYTEKWGARALPLCAIDPDGIVHIFAHNRDVVAKPNWKLVALILPEKEPEKLTES